MNKTKKQNLPTGRYLFIILLIFLVATILLARIIQLQVFDKDFLQQQGKSRTTRLVKLPSYRGIIKDRNGEPLAVTTPVDTVWANPKEMIETDISFKQLSNLLQLSEINLQEKIKSASDKEFVYLKRHINPGLGEKVRNLNLPGIYTSREYKRYYPTGEIAAHVIGFTDIDDKGQEGLELLYDEWLRGVPGLKRVLKDRIGRVISDLELLKEPAKGKDLVLSLDKRLQYIAYRELLAAVEKHKAKAGSLVILDVDSGEILAMVNQPAFNPNNRADISWEKTRNRAVTDVFEPGSVMKAFSVAMALESGNYHPDTPIDTRPGFLKIDNNIVHDIRNFGQLDLTGVIRKSSNVGISKVVLSLEPNSLIKLLSSLGFGLPTGSNFPGEQIGRLIAPRDSDLFSQATQAFGYGLSVNTLQLAQAFAVIANKGIYKPSSFLKLENKEYPKGEKVLSTTTSDQVLAMLLEVIETGGSGSRAAVPGYKVAGKTGTVRKIVSNGYLATKHQSIFAGIIPASAPKLVMVIMIDEPSEGGYYGGLVVAPVFAKVMASAVRLLNLQPDNIL